MPLSDSGNLPAIANELERLQPKGIIELGVGFGLMGALARNYLEARHGRVQSQDWETVIVGVEGFASYSNPCWNCYNNVIVADFRQYYQSVQGWDCVLMIDSLEHVEDTEAKVILEYLVRNNERVIVSVPIGVCPQDGVFGNELETHRSVWYPDSFWNYRHTILHKGVCVVVSIQGGKI